MVRYFIEVAYKGTNYGGFQVQQNTNTIQAEVEKAFSVIQRQPVNLTGSSRTDAGVHALQNFFHFDFEQNLHPQLVYKMNALLPPDVVIKALYTMPADAHARFDAVSRAYEYHIHRVKNPFLQETSYYFPYKVDVDLMNKGAAYLKEQTHFFAFSKTNTQVKNFRCTIKESQWIIKEDQLLYKIEANRFLRGMVRLITATLLKLGRGKLTWSEFESLFATTEKCGFSVPAHGLFLKKVQYPEDYFNKPE